MSAIGRSTWLGSLRIAAGILPLRLFPLPWAVIGIVLSLIAVPAGSRVEAA
jgi:hypothetical protein